MAPKYTMIYFPVKALGEPIRLLLTYGNVEFEDKRISSEEWPQYKDKMPMGQMPVLQIDDKYLYQSTAISRYLGKQYGLAGENDWESMEIDIAIDTLHDIRARAAAVFYNPDESTKVEGYKMLNDNILPTLKKLDEIAGKNKGHMALGKLTWADFYLAGIGDYLSHICNQDIFATYSNLKAAIDQVKSLPAIKAWYAKAPKCDF